MQYAQYEKDSKQESIELHEKGKTKTNKYHQVNYHIHGQ